MASPTDPSHDPSGRPISSVRARALVAAVESRVRALPDSAPADQLDELLTTAAAVRLHLEGERVRARRAATECEDGPGEDALAAAERARERDELLAGQVARLQAVIGDLRAARAHLTRGDHAERPRS